MRLLYTECSCRSVVLSMREHLVNILLLEKKSAQWYPTSYLGYMHFLNERLSASSSHLTTTAPNDLDKSNLTKTNQLTDVIVAALSHEAEELRRVLFVIPETESSILKAPKEFLDDMSKYQSICGASFGPSIDDDGFEIIEK